MRPVLITFFAFLLFHCTTEPATSAIAAQMLVEDCPPEGQTEQEHLKALNKLKNRIEVPTPQQIDSTITLAKLLESGDDRSRWKSGSGAIITGYVYDVKPGGVETCNCKTKDVDKRDTHIELLADPMHDDKLLRVIVEVTPRVREKMKMQGEDWTTKGLSDKLLGRWVKFSGWVLFDAEHASQAENTNPGRVRNWRATAWEIHPVTGFTVATNHMKEGKEEGKE